MAGIPQDTRVCPKDFAWTYNAQQIINRWKLEVGHDTPIRVCGVCGIRDIMTDSECISLPITHNYFKKFLFTGTITGALRQVMHLLEYDGLTYRLADEALDSIDHKILVCSVCINDLKYARRTNKLPIQSIAYHDLGRFPSNIPKLTSTERLAIAKVLVFAPIFELKPVHGARSTGLKGNVVAIPLNSKESLKSVVGSLPRLDLAKRVKVTILAKRSM